MTKPLPKWLFIRYSILWSKFKNKGFGYKEASKSLNEKETVINVVLSNLRKYGWIEIKRDPKNKRKRVYTLRPAIEVIKEIGNENINSKKSKK